VKGKKDLNERGKRCGQEKIIPRRTSKKFSTSANNYTYIYVSIMNVYDTFPMAGSFERVSCEDSGYKKASTNSVKMAQSLKKLQKN
jgi:hypothetical protein